MSKIKSRPTASEEQTVVAYDTGWTPDPHIPALDATTMTPASDDESHGPYDEPYDPYDSYGDAPRPPRTRARPAPRRRHRRNNDWDD